MARFRLRHEVPCPPEHVFEVVTSLDLDIVQAWRPDVTAIEHRPGPMRVGATWLERRIEQGRARALRVRVVGYDPGHLFATEAVDKDTRITSSFILEERDRATRVSYEADMHRRGLSRFWATGYQHPLKDEGLLERLRVATCGPVLLHQGYA